MSELQTYTLSSGKEIQLRRVGYFTLQLVEKNFPRPQAPIDVGTGERNPAHPDYLQAMTAWDKNRNQALADAVLGFGIKAPFEDAEKAELADFRLIAKTLNLDAPADDWMCYIKHVLLSDDDDFVNVQSLITKGTLPAEEVISEAAESFKSPVEGATDSGSVDTEVGGDSRQS